MTLWRPDWTRKLAALINPSIGELAVVTSLGFLFLLAVVLTLKWKLARTTRFVSEQLRQAERQLSEYRTYSRYLNRGDRVALREKLDSTLRSLDFLHAYRMLLGKQQRDFVETSYRTTRELSAFLDQFILEFTKKEVERHRDFFDGKPFDGDQIEAIIKRDVYNLVIAAAGSGKTRTLTSRIAFMTKCGAAPDKILALAYTNPAEDEMRLRLKSEYGIHDANVRTFHSFARELAMSSPNFRNGVANGRRQQEFIAESVRRLQSGREFAVLLLNFALESRTQEPQPDDFADPAKYYEFLRNQRYLTLTGMHVNSIAERDIANFLFLNRVKFGYEISAIWADRSPGFRQYQPDFFLTEYGIWMEHWAIDRQSKVPGWFEGGRSSDASIRYREEMRWKRGQFKKHGRRLIETYSYQWTEGTLIPELRRQLEENRVVLKQLSVQGILRHIRELIVHRDPLYELMFSFISKAKTNGLTIGDIKSRLAYGNWSRKQQTFASLMILVWQEYESLLEQNDMIDFNDMINLALQVARQKEDLAGKYSHIMIDEFQDITNPQLEIIQCLLGKDESSTLFCVGDDGQNIFSFAGSDIYNILRFDERFPCPEMTVLSTNYRCPKNVVEASNFIANLNRLKIEKRLVPATQVQRPIRLTEMPADEMETYDDWEYREAMRLLKQLVESREPDEEIMVLARFNYPLRRLKQEFPNQEDLRLRFLSIHRAKGTEADYVLLLGCISGRNGFPSEITDQRILDIVKKRRGDEADKLEEERRLFYVALTRCRKELFLFSSRRARSQFVSELMPYLATRGKRAETQDLPVSEGIPAS